MRNDAAGQGHFGASRGRIRVHNGVDYAAHPGSLILSPVSGEVTKIGQAYTDTPKWKYVQITTEDTRGKRKLHHRVFYVVPKVAVGDYVHEGIDVIGEASDIRQRYPELPAMTPHCHYEIKVEGGDANGQYLDPESYTEHGA